MTLKELKFIHIGTSGWYYNHWKDSFYPEGIDKETYLEYYVKRFDTVEVNNTFYRLPPKKVFSIWEKKVKEDFLFSLKASRYITHTKRLIDCGIPLGKFMSRAVLLGAKLGPILFQFPPGWDKNIRRLYYFLEELKNYKKNKFVFEFRNVDWFDNETKGLLSDFGAGFCIYHSHDTTSPVWVTSDFAYLRLHGPEEKYGGSYSTPALKKWAREILKWTEDGKDVFCYFNNDIGGNAPRDALRLKEIIEDYLSKPTRAPVPGRVLVSK